jgi:hypothetical protein
VFRRLLFEDAAALFTLVAFITAVSIFVTIAWRALRMKRPQVERFENLPFGTPTPAAVERALTARPQPETRPADENHSLLAL